MISAMHFTIIIVTIYYCTSNSSTKKPNVTNEVYLNCRLRASLDTWQHEQRQQQQRQRQVRADREVAWSEHAREVNDASAASGILAPRYAQQHREQQYAVHAVDAHQ